MFGEYLQNVWSLIAECLEKNDLLTKNTAKKDSIAECLEKIAAIFWFSLSNWSHFLLE